MTAHTTQLQPYPTAQMLLDAAIAAGMPAQLPINVDVIASLLGIAVRNDVGLEYHGVIGKIEFESGLPVISINPIQNRYEPRRRFTLAHELGHYCLHTSQSGQGFTDSRQSMSRSATYWDPMEREANAFAAELLMPTSLIFTTADYVINTYDQASKNEKIDASLFVTQMADIFIVSNESMTYRLQGLGILER